MSAGGASYDADLIGVDVIFFCVNSQELNRFFAVIEISRPGFLAFREEVIYAYANIALTCECFANIFLTKPTFIAACPTAAMNNYDAGTFLVFF